MWIQLKDGVDMQRLHAGLYLGIEIASRVYAKYGHTAMTITSARDGKHLPNSLHYEGRAVDLRTWGIVNVHEFGAALREALGQDYAVIVEIDHIHMSYPGNTGKK